VDTAIFGSCVEERKFPARRPPLAPPHFAGGFHFADVVFTAPNPRYLGSITWFLPLAPALALAFVTLTFCVNYFALGTLRYNTEWSWKKPAPQSPEIPKVDLRQGENPFGVHLFYPRKGDQTFDAPLPSAKTLHPTLKYLDETRGLAGGFCDARIESRDSENEDPSTRRRVFE
jgi:hypothetical protein